jgi:hypothetical protein
LAPGQSTEYLLPPNYANRVKLDRIWAPTCLSGRQSVSFTKVFKAPGRPSSGHLYLDPAFGFPKPFIGVDILVNGRSIGYLGNISTGKIAQYISAPLKPDALTSFHYGTNKLTIRADKIALKKGERCNTRNRIIGVLAKLSLRFEPDIEALPSPKGREEAVRKAPGAVVGALGTLRFVNHGPSGSSGGKLILRISGSSHVQTAWGRSTLQVEPPFHDCEGEGLGVAVQGTITCQYSDFPAGLSTSVIVIAGGRLMPTLPPDSSTNLVIDWQIIPAGYDQHAENNSYSHNFTICGPRSTEARCLGAK